MPSIHLCISSKLAKLSQQQQQWMMPQSRSKGLMSFFRHALQFSSIQLLSVSLSLNISAQAASQMLHISPIAFSKLSRVSFTISKNLCLAFRISLFSLSSCLSPHVLCLQTFFFPSKSRLLTTQLSCKPHLGLLRPPGRTHLWSRNLRKLLFYQFFTHFRMFLQVLTNAFGAEWKQALFVFAEVRDSLIIMEGTSNIVADSRCINDALMVFITRFLLSLRRVGCQNEPYRLVGQLMERSSNGLVFMSCILWLIVIIQQSQMYIMCWLESVNS